MQFFHVQSGKIYTRQNFFTQACGACIKYEVWLDILPLFCGKHDGNSGAGNDGEGEGDGGVGGERDDGDGGADKGDGGGADKGGIRSNDWIFSGRPGHRSWHRRAASSPQRSPHCPPTHQNTHNINPDTFLISPTYHMLTPK